MPKLLIVGLGDVARRALPELLSFFEVTALSRSPMSNQNEGVIRHMALDLDAVTWTDAQKKYVAQAFDAVLYTAPPNAGNDSSGDDEDVRLRRLLSFWQQSGVAPQRVVYVSTTGVYGDCAGAWVDEATPLNPQSMRAKKRVAAERQWREFAYGSGAQVTVLRAPGIYALERLPYESVLSGSPVLLPDEDSFSNHIHADDLARACAFFLNQPTQDAACLPFEVFNVCDDEPILMGEWMSALARALQRAHPQRISRAQMQVQVSPMRWSFMRESRRIRNAKLKSAGFELNDPLALAFVSAHAEAIRTYAVTHHHGGAGDA